MIRRPPRSPLFPYAPLFRSRKKRTDHATDPRGPINPRPPTRQVCMPHQDGTHRQQYPGDKTMSNQVTRRDILQGLAAIGGTSLLATGATSALAQAGKPAAWPTKPIRVVVPFNAGGATDLISRTIGEALARRVGQPLVIDNRAGAAGILGPDPVVKG